MKKFVYIKEDFYKYFLIIFSFTSLICLVGIMIVLFKESFPAFKHFTFSNLFFNKFWYPTSDPPEFGLLALIIGSLSVTFVAFLVAVPLGLGSALYIYEIAPIWQKKFLKFVIEILASIPSVVYGLFGIVVMAPFLQKIFHMPTGLCLLTAGVILGIMATPTVCSISEDALASVPKSLREGSLALGATRWQTLTRIIFPAAGSGISTAIILGISRAIGETMTVLMVSGGAAMIPTTLFEPVRTMTGTIAAEMGEAVYKSDHYHVLFVIGLVLFIFTFLFNITAELISRKYRLKLGQGR